MSTNANDEDENKGVFSFENWVRLFYCLIFWFTLYLGAIAVFIVVVIQFFFVLTGNSAGEKSKEIGRSLALYFKQCLLYVTFNTDEKPFPFSDWPH